MRWAARLLRFAVPALVALGALEASLRLYMESGLLPDHARPWAMELA